MTGHCQNPIQAIADGRVTQQTHAATYLVNCPLWHYFSYDCIRAYSRGQFLRQGAFFPYYPVGQAGLRVVKKRDLSDGQVRKVLRLIKRREGDPAAQIPDREIIPLVFYATPEPNNGEGVRLCGHLFFFGNVIPFREAGRFADYQNLLVDEEVRVANEKRLGLPTPNPRLDRPVGIIRCDPRWGLPDNQRHVMFFLSRGAVGMCPKTVQPYYMFHGFQHYPIAAIDPHDPMAQERDLCLPDQSYMAKGHEFIIHRFQGWPDSAPK